MKRLNQDLKTIVDGIEDKKGQTIRVMDLAPCGDTICRYMVVCEGHTPTQVHAIAEGVGEKMNSQLGLKPIAVEGLRNSLWVAMDYVDIMVHIFVPESRLFYDIDHLWDDAEEIGLQAPS